MNKKEKKSNDRIASAYFDPVHLDGITENAVFPDHINKENYKPRSLVDTTLECIDPTPNVHSMFVQFNERFFWNKLLSVQVKWSNRMTTCAGICSFHPRNRECIISLSTPLLKLRPRKDLVETLLHEMIHAFLFLTNNNRDRDGHGPEFCKHMNRINGEAGTKITIYHSFHNEVKLYKQHWWKCDGPCRNKPPYYGTVKRAMNRAPGPSDFWYNDHQKNCGGNFIKIKEPEKTQSKKSNESPKVASNQRNLDNYVTFTNLNTSTKKIPSPIPRNSELVNNIRKISQINSSPILSGNLVKLGNNTNNVYGFGTGGPGSSGSSERNKNKNPTQRKSIAVNFSGVLGGRPLGNGNKNIKNSESNQDTADCPVCSKKIPTKDLNTHLDACLLNSEDKNSTTPPPKRLRARTPDSNNPSNLPELAAGPANANPLPIEFVECPNCVDIFHIEEINNHLDTCLNINQSTTNNIQVTQESTDDVIEISDTDFVQLSDSKKSIESGSVICCPICDKDVLETEYPDHSKQCMEDYKKKSEDEVRKSNNDEKKEYHCLICNEKINIPIDKHLKNCIKLTYYNDDEDSIDELSEPKNSCPICQKDIIVKLLAEHIDECIGELSGQED